MLAVIPARGGSKGVPHKNIKMLAGKPLIAYTIEAALQSGVFRDVIVSTDDEEIAKVAVQWGANVPFVRPANISGDKASSDEVILHALHFFEEKDKRYEAVCKLQPTSPFRTSKDIQDAYQKFRDRNCDYLVSVCECEHSPLWCGTLGPEENLDDFVRDEVIRSCRQDLPTYYRLNGAIYMAKTDKFHVNRSFFGENGVAYIMSQEKSIDIDSKLDFMFAENIINGSIVD